MVRRKKNKEKQVVEIDVKTRPAKPSRIPIRIKGQRINPTKTPMMDQKIKNISLRDNLPTAVQAAATKAAKDISVRVKSTPPLSGEGIGFVEHILNPCGEHTHPNARCTDGTLSQSAVQTLRTEDFVVPPFISLASVGDTTKNWSLIDIGLPSYTGISLLIASANASDPTPRQWRSILTQINGSGVADYPTWTPIGPQAQANFFATYWRYEAANLKYDAKTRQSTTVESFRYVGDGIVLRHNSPDLWNQGGFVTGQFQCDMEYINADGAPASIEVQSDLLAVGESKITLTNLKIGLTTELIGTVTPNVFLLIPVGEVNNGETKTFPTNVWDSAYTIRKPDGSYLVEVDADANFDWSIKYDYASRTLAISTPTTAGDPFIVSVAIPKLSNTQLYSTDTSLGAEDDKTSIVIDLPSLSWSNIAQADPKRASDLLKGHNGFYSVRRYFQPKLLMQKSNRSGNIKFSVPGMERLAIVNAPGGIVDDLIDNNASIRISVIRGISYAAIPQIKGDRFIELMPAPGSILASVTEITPARDEDAEEVFRALQARGEHAYTPDANLLGELATFITTAVGSLEVFLRGARSVSQAIDKAASWTQKKLGFVE